MNYCKVFFIILILLNVSFQQALMAQPRPGHVIPMEELEKQLAVQSTQRLGNIQEIRKLLHHDLVQKELGKLVDFERVELALASLDDQTLEELAKQSRQVNDQIEAGLSIAAWIVIIVAIPIVIFLVWWAANDN